MGSVRTGSVDIGWFAGYLDAFAACARGERDVSDLLHYYGVPLIVTSDAGAVTLTGTDAVAALIQGELDGLRGIGYHHTDVLHSDVTTLNRASTLYRVSLSRRDRTGAEVGRPTVSYLVTEGDDGPRISVLAAHGS